MYVKAGYSFLFAESFALKVSVKRKLCFVTPYKNYEGVKGFIYLNGKEYSNKSVGSYCHVFQRLYRKR